MLYKIILKDNSTLTITGDENEKIKKILNTPAKFIEINETLISTSSILKIVRDTEAEAQEEKLKHSQEIGLENAIRYGTCPPETKKAILDLLAGIKRTDFLIADTCSRFSQQEDEGFDTGAA